MSLTSAQRLKNLGQAVCPARPAGLGSTAPGLVANVPARLRVVCWVMVTRKGSRLHASVAFKCWVRNLAGYFMPTACLSGLGACVCQQGSQLNPSVRGTEEFPSRGLKLQGCLWGAQDS